MIVSFLRFIPLAIVWIPHVIRGVIVIESLFGSGKPGEEKKAAVLAWLSATGARLGLPWTGAAIAAISDLIDTVVSILNFVGAFRGGGEAIDAGVLVSDETAVVTNRSIADALEDDPELAAFMERSGL